MATEIVALQTIFAANSVQKSSAIKVKVIEVGLTEGHDLPNGKKFVVQEEKVAMIADDTDFGVVVWKSDSFTRSIRQGKVLLLENFELLGQKMLFLTSKSEISIAGKSLEVLEKVPKLHTLKSVILATNPESSAINRDPESAAKVVTIQEALDTAKLTSLMNVEAWVTCTPKKRINVAKKGEPPNYNRTITIQDPTAKAFLTEWSAEEIPRTITGQKYLITSVYVTPKWSDRLQASRKTKFKRLDKNQACPHETRLSEKEENVTIMSMNLAKSFAYAACPTCKKKTSGNTCSSHGEIAADQLFQGCLILFKVLADETHKLEELKMFAEDAKKVTSVIPETFDEDFDIEMIGEDLDLPLALKIERSGENNDVMTWLQTLA